MTHVTMMLATDYLFDLLLRCFIGDNLAVSDFSKWTADECICQRLVGELTIVFMPFYCDNMNFNHASQLKLSKHFDINITVA